MTVERTSEPEHPGILFAAMPYASAASLKHAVNLLDCLVPHCRRVFIVADRRMDLGSWPRDVVCHRSLPPLHYVNSRDPYYWSVIQWILKVVWVLLRASWAVVETRKQSEIVVSFLGAYSAPVFLCAHLLGKKTLTFFVNSDASLAEMAYQGRRGRFLLVTVLRLAERLNRHLVDIFAVESQRLAGPLGLGGDLDRVRVGNNYVDTDSYKVLVPLPDRPRVVGFLGRLAPGKGVMQLLAAAALVREAGVKFQIVGDGPLRGEVESALRRPELSHVELVGWLEADTIVEWLNRCRLLVLPTDSEGLPDSVLEAMACGTPVLATAVGAIPDLIDHEVTGFILPDRDPQTFAGAIRKALDHPDLNSIADRAREHVLRTYSLAAVSSRWHIVLDELAMAPAGRPGVVRR